MGTSTTRECPHCQAICPTSAQICYRCKKPMPPPVVWTVPAEERAALEASLAAAAPDTPLRSKQPGRWRARTGWSFFAAVALFILTGAVAEFFAVFVVIALAMFLIYLVEDLTTPSPRGRKSPDAAALAYFQALRRKQWKAAFFCLSPLARQRVVAVPSSSTLATRPRTLTLLTPDYVEEYGKALVHKSDGTRRKLQRVKAEVIDTGEQIARVRVTLTIWALQGFFTTNQSVVITAFEVLAHKHAYQWWLTSGAIHLPGGRDEGTSQAPVL